MTRCAESKVTIGICVKNAALTIKEALESVLAQDYSHELIEMIIVDGYSNDKTLEIVKNILKKSDIKVRFFSENVGLGYARQIVVNKASGDFIIWVDGDMILPKDFVRRQVEYMEHNKDVGIAKGRYGIINENNLVADLENIEFVMKFNKEGEATDIPLGASGCIYRTNAIREAGGFDENIKGVGEDMDIEYKIMVKGWKIHVSPAYFYEKRRRTWRELWGEYFWHGKGGFQIYKKNRRIITTKINKFFLSLMFKKIHQTIQAYKLTYRKRVFILPIHYIFKRIGWILGFLTEYIKWCYRNLVKSEFKKCNESVDQKCFKINTTTTNVDAN